MEKYFITLGIWIICGLIAVILGYIFFHEKEDKIKIWNIISIIALGFFGLLFIINDIDDKRSY